MFAWESASVCIGKTLSGTAGTLAINTPADRVVSFTYGGCLCSNSLTVSLDLVVCSLSLNLIL